MSTLVVYFFKLIILVGDVSIYVKGFSLIRDGFPSFILYQPFTRLQTKGRKNKRVFFKYVSYQQLQTNDKYI